MTSQENAEREQFRPGGSPALPEIFLGREDDMLSLKSRLGVGDAGGESHLDVQVLTAVRGWPGIGKTAIATVLANDEEVKTTFADGVLWVSLGQTPNLITELAAWGRSLGTEDILRAPTLREATERLRVLLHDKQALLVVDDVWKAEHVIPFRQARGPNCALLITTRETGLVDALSLPDKAIHVLPPLTEERALDLLRLLAPEVVEAFPEKCLELVRSLESLPLALHVAGRLLKAESRKGWGVEELIKDLREGKRLIVAKAPDDRIDLERETIPTVAALLRKTTDLLDEQTRECFAFLGPFAPKPATFDLDAMAVVWGVKDPKPIAGTLIDHGLLEPAGARYQMHALLVMHALSLLR
jgi:hypothetical protein